MLEKQLKTKCEELLNESIESAKKINGGDINDAYCLTTENNRYFCKANFSNQGKNILYQERFGLHALSKNVNTPKVKNFSDNVLILEWLVPVNKTKKFWIHLGEGLAKLHKNSSNNFGFEQSNFIGSLPQSNKLGKTWSEFYTINRLIPQFKIAIDKGLLSKFEIPSEEDVQTKIAQICPTETARLTHGDLWSGNIYSTHEDAAYFIDPSVSFAHREIDIAMSALFGKFDEQFYETYNEIIPLEQGWKSRLDIYHLYYLLAHLNMFGIGYKNDVITIVKKYFF